MKYIIIHLFIIYIYVFYKKIRKPLIYCQYNKFTNKVYNRVKHLQKVFFPFFIYTKGIFESKIYQFRKHKKRFYEELILYNESNEKIFVDFYKKNDEENDINIILVHGFNGSSNSSYITNLAYTLIQYNVFAITTRGTLEELKSKEFFHVGRNKDVEILVDFINNNYKGNILLIGFSMGGSWITNYIAKSDCKNIIGGIGVCVPFDFYKLSKNMEEGLFPFLMANEFKKYLSKNSVFDSYNYKNLNTVEELDRLITIDIFGFKSTAEYYTNESCVSRLSKIKVPMLFINTKDDPIIPFNTVPYKKIVSNPLLILCILEAGGHLCLLDFFYRKSFVEMVVVDFINVIKEKEDYEGLQVELEKKFEFTKEKEV